MPREIVMSAAISCDVAISLTLLTRSANTPANGDTNTIGIDLASPIKLRATGEPVKR